MYLNPNAIKCIVDIRGGTDHDSDELTALSYVVILGISFDMDRLLMDAAYRGRLDIAKFLVDNGADIKRWNYEALKASIEAGHETMMKFLVSIGSKCTRECLTIAMRCGHKSIAEFLIARR